MADIEIQISGAKGIGKTTFAKYLFSMLANTPYWVEAVDDDGGMADHYITDLTKAIMPRRRAPRTVRITIRDSLFRGEIVLDDEDDPYS